MNRKILLFVFVFGLFTSSSLFSQVAPALSYTVKGMVMDSVSKESIPYVTISVSSVEKPEVYLKRIASGITGGFELGVAKTGEYLLSFESVGMKKHTLNITITPEEKTLSLGKILLVTASKSLAEVTVSAIKPLIKVDLDKISYDMKSDPESQSATTLDMLRKVPLVTVDGDDKIQLKGSSNFKVYINGKPSGMTTNNPSQALKSMPASSVKSIEVITEPGAKYDAEGLGGIINIVTDRSLTGITGTVRTGADTRGSYYDGIYFSSKVGKFGITANINYNNQNNPETSHSERENLNPQSVKYILQDGHSRARYTNGYGNVDASYEFDSLNLVSFSVNGYIGGTTSSSDGNTSMLALNRDTLSAYHQLLKSTGSWGGVDMSLDYQRSFKKPDQLFTLSYRFSRTPDDNDNLSNLTGLLNYANSSQHISSKARGDEHTFQADYTEPFHKMHVVEFGAKYILRLNNSTNNYLEQNQTTLGWESIPGSPQNNLDQTQDILGAYASYTLKLKKFNIRAGIRYEHAWSNLALTDTSFRANSQNFVPSVSMSYKFSETSELRLSYNQRISRPGIWYLNPFADTSNPNAISQGNPNLKSEIENSFSLNYSYITPKLTANTSLYTSFTDNSIERVSKLLNDSVEFSTYKNIGVHQNSGLSLSVNWQPEKTLRLYTNDGVGYMHLTTIDGSGLKNSGFNYNVSAGSQITLPYDIKWNLNAGCYSPNINLQGQNSGFVYYNTTFAHAFFQKKLNMIVRASNFITKNRDFTSFIRTTGYHTNTVESYLARNFGLTFIYTFGKLNGQIKKAERTIENTDVKSGGQSGGGGQ